MKRRVLTGVLLAALVVWLATQPREWLFFLALLATVEISLHEFFGVCRKAGLAGWPWPGYIGAGVLCASQLTALSGTRLPILVLLLVLVILVPIIGLALQPNLKGYAGAFGSTLLGVLYIGFTFSWLLPLRFTEPVFGKRLIIFLFALIWLQDVAAYFVGRFLGRTRLAPKISPKKTVEGAVAGLVTAVLIGWVFAHWFWQTGDPKAVMLVAGVVGVIGQAGDLVESALKRAADVKDSGALLPGHGGLLDRVDSLLLGAPVFWIMWTLMGLWR